MSILFRKRPRTDADDREDELPRLSARGQDEDDYPMLEAEEDDIPVLTPGTHHKLGRQPVPTVQPSRQTPPVAAVRYPDPAAPHNSREPQPATQYAAAQPESAPEPIPPGTSHVRPGGLFASEPGPEAAIQRTTRAFEATIQASEPPAQTASPPVQQPQNPASDPAWLHNNPAAPHSSVLSSQELSRIIDRIVNFELEQAHQRIRLRLMTELDDMLKDR